MITCFITVLWMICGFVSWKWQSFMDEKKYGNKLNTMPLFVHIMLGLWALFLTFIVDFLTYKILKRFFWKN